MMTMDLDLRYTNLRFLTKADLEMVLMWRNHQEIRKWMVNQDIISYNDHLSWFRRCQESSNSVNLIFEYQELAQGYVSFTKIRNSRAYEWGFYMQPKSPKGMGMLLGKRSIEYTFMVLGADKLFGQVLSFNKKSILFHERLGFLQEGLLRKHLSDDRGVFDIYQFGLLRSEWLKDGK